MAGGSRADRVCMLSRVMAQLVAWRPCSPVPESQWPGLDSLPDGGEISMKRTLFLTLGFIMALAVGGLLLPTLGSQANAGSNCKSFAALGHAVLTSSTPLALTDTWGG